LLMPAKLVFSIVSILLKLLKNHLAKKSMMSISEKIKRKKLKEIHFFLKNVEIC
jgi:predicted glycosyltransferase